MMCPLSSSGMESQWGGERNAGAEKATYHRTPLQLYHRYARQSAHIRVPLISRLEASASRMEQCMTKRAIRVPETHIVGMVLGVA
jgi:hypothetical protein